MAGPHLICDKSTIQSLSRGELDALRRYYSLNIPPVLLLEILGDLKKAEDLEACRNEVRSLANRLVPNFSSVNVEFRDLVLGEMQNPPLKMTGVPMVGGGKSVSSSGMKGVIVDTNPEETALLRWQAGAFHEVEGLLAEHWRRSTHAVDLENLQRRLRKHYSARLKLRTLSEVAEFVDDLMTATNPEILILWFLEDAEIGTEELRVKLYEVARSSKFSLEASLPFTAYCIRTALIFHFGLAFGLISTRPTNRVDLEYFYYMPFCGVFSSGDVLHRDLFPHIFRGKQAFVSRDELKEDLKRLAQWWQSLGEGEREVELRFSGPPEDENSVTHRLWKNGKPDYKRDFQDECEPSEKSLKVMAHVRELLSKELPSEDDVESGSLEGCDYFVVKKTVRLDGPCVCGSGELLRNCHGKHLAGRQSSTGA